MIVRTASRTSWVRASRTSTPSGTVGPGNGVPLLLGAGDGGNRVEDEIRVPGGLRGRGHHRRRDPLPRDFEALPVDVRNDEALRPSLQSGPRGLGERLLG